MNSSVAGAAPFSSIGRRWFYVWCIAAIALFAVFRFPMVIHMAGHMDEQFFAVPGLTVLEEGIPRIPYCPTRYRETYFENADKCLFTLPPALHYVQAPFFAIMKAGYVPARMPPFLAGIAAIACVAGLAYRRISEPWILGLSLVTFAISRPLMFTSIIARPDLLCAVCGWSAMIVLERALSSGRYRWIALAGALCGLGGLFHPYALIFCIQAGVWVLSMRGTFQIRLARVCLLTACAVAVLLLWLPLIVSYPYEFRSQFISNVVERPGPGLLSRVYWPWAAVEKHFHLALSLNEPCQLTLLLTGLIVGTGVWLRKNRDAMHVRYLALTWSACYLTIVVVGSHHTRVYWIYPIGLIYPLAIDGIVRSLQAVGHWLFGLLAIKRIGKVVVPIAISLAILAIMIPGAGFRSSITYLRHWGDSRFHAQHFIEGVLKDMPQEGLFMPDSGYVFDVYLSGRKTLICQPRQKFWRDEQLDIDYMLLNEEGNDYQYAADYPELPLEKHVGASDSPQDCYVDIYVRDRLEGSQ